MRTPSSACGARSSVVKDEVTSAPLSVTAVASSGTDAGTTTRTRAAPPLTYWAGPESISSRSAPCRPGGGPGGSGRAAEGAATIRQTAASVVRTETGRFIVSSPGFCCAADATRSNGLGAALFRSGVNRRESRYQTRRAKWIRSSVRSGSLRSTSRPKAGRSAQDNCFPSTRTRLCSRCSARCTAATARRHSRFRTSAAAWPWAPARPKPERPTTSDRPAARRRPS